MKGKPAPEIEEVLTQATKYASTMRTRIKIDTKEFSKAIKSFTNTVKKSKLLKRPKAMQEPIIEGRKATS